VRSRYALYQLAATMRLDEALAAFERALEIDPLSATVHAGLGHHLIYRRDMQRAVEELQLATELDPGYWMAHCLLAGAYMLQGMFDKSIAICDKVLEAIGPNATMMSAAACVRALMGDRRGAEDIRRQLIESRRAKHVSALGIAWICLGLGEPEPCLDWLERAVDEREPWIVEFQPKALYDPLRHHPRFQALLRTMHLPPRQVI
jgi:tetratricopeptide (TPR) repeat protein